MVSLPLAKEIMLILETHSILTLSCLGALLVHYLCLVYIIQPVVVGST